MMHERSKRLAENEAVFRAGNEAIDVNRAYDANEEGLYLCECGVDTCFQRVALTKAEYEAVRSHPARFFVALGHEDVTAGEIVVEESSRYAVVEKRGEERKIAESRDPRSSREQ